jgi:hypothetical protein
VIEMSDEQKDKIFGSDPLIVLPVLGTTAAVCWESGKLYQFGGFQYFSITDHALATLDALPLIVGMIAFSAIFFWLGAQLVARLSKRISKLATFIAMALLFVCLRVAGALVVKDYSLSNVLANALLIGVLLWTANTVWWRYPLTKGAGLVVSVILTALFTFAVANRLADLWIRRPQNHLSNVYLNSGQEIDGVVVMSGERGVLVYETTRNRMLYLKSETIERVEWPRHNPVLPETGD